MLAVVCWSWYAGHSRLAVVCLPWYAGPAGRGMLAVVCWPWYAGCGGRTQSRSTLVLMKLRSAGKAKMAEMICY